MSIAIGRGLHCLVPTLVVFVTAGVIRLLELTRAAVLIGWTRAGQ